VTAAPVEETVRRTVSVVFCDLSGSTALGESRDPELMRSVVTRYFRVVSDVMERYGGTVEKFIGDAVMTVFGVPELHEDDALRAVRAADAARAAVEVLNDDLERDHGLRIAVRLGVETGEVVVGDGSRGTVATGDAVNVAARLEQVAGPGEVVVGPSAWRLVRDLATGEATEPLALKGKSAGVPAWRLVSVVDERSSERRLVHTPLVGRDRELALLGQTLDRATAERSCHLVTLLGVPGVGKTRLTATFLEGLPDGTVVLRGRCLPYGDAVGLWPLRQILRAAAAATPTTTDDEVRDRLLSLLGDEADAAAVAERLGVLAGRTGSAPTKDETAWAVRRLLEAMGRATPVVVVVDDVHWADPALVDVLDHVADWVRDSAVLLVCVSRPELLDLHPTWAGGRMNASSLLLSPLGTDETAELLGALAGDATMADDVAEAMLRASAGVPLYAEHLFAMLVEERRVERQAGQWRWAEGARTLDAPPTIAAILATRLAHLDPGPRAALEAASVVGEVFYRGAVVELLDDLEPDDVAAALTTLLRRQLVRPDASDIAGEDALRFVHVLVQDVTYSAISKTHRADLHLRLARWLAKRVDAGEGVDAFVGHHLASCVELSDEVGTRDELTQDVAAEAVSVLRRAAGRIDVQDPAGASALLARAAAVADDATVEAGLHFRRSLLLRNTTDVVTGITAWRLAHDAATRSDDARWQLLVRISGSTLAVQLPHLGVVGLTDDELYAARDRFTADGDDEGLCAVLNALADRGAERAIWGDHLALLDDMAASATRTGDMPTLVAAKMRAVGPCLWGPVPASEALVRLEHLLGDPLLQVRELQIGIHGARAAACAMLDLSDDARRHLATAATLATELHISALTRTMAFGYTNWLLRDLDRAAELFQFGLDMLGPQGEVGWVSTLLPMLGEVRLAQGDEVAARECAERARDICPPADIESNARWRGLLALVESRAGRHDRAVRLAQEAVDWELRGDQLDSIGDRYQDQAVVLSAAGRRDAAVEALDRAIEVYRRKENVASVRRAAELRARI
jgi:class 3 adenylate cyclase/tetratricopeptide (TPR) repeat protein